MIGEKKLKDIKASIRDAFAKKGVDAETWLDEQMAKLGRHQKAEQGVAESLGLIRDGLRTEQPAKKKGDQAKEEDQKTTSAVNSSWT